MKASIVIRTLNEARHLPELLLSIKEQSYDGEIEVIVVDSGSTDRTVEIAEMHGAKLVYIKREDFSFGRSLNYGCAAATGDHLIFISGHCIPVNERWLDDLTRPLRDGQAVYSYGRQIGNHVSRFSECQLFNKYFPAESAIPQEGFFANNANSALVRTVWQTYRFDESLTGLEDMELGKRLVADDLRIAYVAEAAVYHLHDENWRQVRRRYEREAIALQRIMPEVQMNLADFARYFASAVLLDTGAALQEGKRASTYGNILAFRLMQFWGSYRGNHDHRKLSRQMKEKYFYPR